MRLSVEKFLANLSHYVGNKRIGLITNPSGVDSKLRSSVDLLHETGQLTALYGLEHGVRGDIQAGEKVSSTHDEKTKLPVYSLYGKTKQPTADMVKEIDVWVFHIQDIGCRFYTYLYSLLYLLQAGAKLGIPIILLDCPNPIGADKVEGNILEEEFISFVGYPIPIRYGMTLGELGIYFNEVYDINADLQVVPLEGYQRDTQWGDLKQPWIPPSPNIPTVQTALVYPGTCLVEGTNLSEGRGTTQPFEVIGAPWLNPERLIAELGVVEGAILRPTSFIPTFSKFPGELCRGVQIHVTNHKQFQPVRTGVHLIAAIARLHQEFSFISPPPGKKFFFDLLAGTDQLRKLITEQQAVEPLLTTGDQKREAFLKGRREYLLYS